MLNVIELDAVYTRLGSKLVHENVAFEVRAGEVLAVVGRSGSGKSTLLREMVLLQRQTSGTITVLGHDTSRLREREALELRRRLGVLFQFGGLFGALSALENVALPLREHTDLEEDTINEVSVLKLSLVGLSAEAGKLYPAQLSGGMRKRVGLARALALDPEILLLDEPTSGLDPVTADALDALLIQLKQSLHLTVVMATHDVDSLWRAADRVVLLGDGRVQGLGSMSELSRSEKPAITSFFAGPRGRAAQRQAWTSE